MKPIIILFYGISGSGKTTLARDFCREYGAAAKHVELDHYYNTITNLGTVNVYRPELLNWNLIRDDMQSLKEGKIITMPLYDMSTATSYEKKGEAIVPEEVIVCTSMYGFDDRVLQGVWDLKVFITPCQANHTQDPFDATVDRRIKRDTEERNRTPEWVREQTSVMRLTDAQLNYQESAHESADMILINTDNQKPDLSPVKEMVIHLLKKRQCMSARAQFIQEQQKRQQPAATSSNSGSSGKNNAILKG